jgi:radical SAM-linked protein
MDDLPEVQRKQEILRSAARKVKGLQLRVHDSRTSVIEGVLARGDRSLWRVIERVYLNGGRFDSWEDQLRLDLWQEAFEHFGVQTERYLGTIPVDARLPWDHFDIGLEDGFLAREYRKAVQSRLSPPCGKAAGMFIHHTNLLDAQADARRLVCYDCGIACDLTKMRDDRVRHLRVMNALEPRLGRLEASQPKPIPDPTEPSPLPQPEPIPDPVPQPDPNPVVRRHGPEAFRPQRTGKPERYRIRFAKCGASALLGHLDLIRELPRVVRRAGIKTWYSEGFHPKPDMSFGPALSLGVASVDEYVDMKLADAPDTNELVERLNRAASGGLSFLDARLLGPSDAAVTRVITGAHYVIALAADVVEAEGGRDAIRQRIETFLQQEKVVVRRQIQGVGKLVNVRGYVSELRLGEEHAETVLARAGIVGRVHALETTIQITQTGSAKVSELVQALFGRADVPHHAVRARMVAGETHPLDLATLRTARERPTAPAAAAAAMG